jgi:hypothetical protein
MAKMSQKFHLELELLAYTVITDDEADDMELQEETKSVSTTEDADNVILRGDYAVRPSSDLTAHQNVTKIPPGAGTAQHGGDSCGVLQLSVIVYNPTGL